MSGVVHLQVGGVERMDWGLVHASERHCLQTAYLQMADGSMVGITVTWPAAMPSAPVVASIQPRDGGPTD